MITETAKVQLLEFGKRLNGAKHGEKSKIVAEAIAYFGFSNHHKFYNELKKLGWSSGKKTRFDAGSTSPTLCEYSLGSCLRRWPQAQVTQRRSHKHN